MLPSKGRLLFETFKSSFTLFNIRSSTFPQSVKSSESSPILLERQKKESFMKNVFLGKVDDDFLSFSSNKRTDVSGKLKELKTLFSEYCEKQTGEPQSYNKYLTFLAEHGFFCLSNRQKQSDAITSTELLWFYENLNLNPCLAVLLEVHSSLVIPALLNHGSSQQQNTYLNQLLQGKITGAYALLEENCSSDPSSVSSTATETGENFLLNGEKYWVTNAVNADFYIVFANVSIDQLKKSDTDFVKDLSVFLVDKSEKLAIKEHNLLGLNACDVGRIKFTDHYISNNNLLGEIGNGFKIAGEGLSNHKFIVLASILSSLKNLTSDLAKHINKQKQFPRDLKDCDFIKKKLANIVSIAYCLESMLYFTCDLLDKYIIDTSLESVLLQIYGFEHGFQALVECLEILGSRSYDKSYEYEKFLRDLIGLKLFTVDINVAQHYASLVGLDHSGNYLREAVFKNRNPFNYPTYIFKKMFRDRRLASGSPKLNLKLYLNLHPSLKVPADQLEYCVLRFNYIVELLLTRHGSEIVNRQLELKRISEIALDIFTMTSVLSRASHSYCTGKHYCDQEVSLAQTICFELFSRTKKTVDSIIDIDTSLNDSIALGIGTAVLNNQSYFFENPQRSNI